jgi:enterochelin esterase-like enzyme
MNTDLIMDDNVILILKNIQKRTEEMKKNNRNKKYNIYKPNEKRHLGVELMPLIRQSYETYNSENTTENTTENITTKIPYEPEEEETKL